MKSQYLDLGYLSGLGLVEAGTGRYVAMQAVLFPPRFDVPQRSWALKNRLGTDSWRSWNCR